MSMEEGSFIVNSSIFLIFKISPHISTGMLQAWFCLMFIFLFLEMGHPGLLYFLSFSFGALCSFVATLYGACILSQLIIFVVGTCGALLILHAFLKKRMNHVQSPSHRSNLDALIGKKVVVYQSLEDKNIWQAKVSGQVWLVRAVHDQILKQGQEVIVIDVQGCHLRVDSIK